MKKALRMILLLFFIGLLGISVWKIVEIQRSYQIGEDVYSALQQYAHIPETEPTKSNGPDRPQHGRPEIYDEDDTQWPAIDFEALREINPEIVGWIYIEGTDVNYPVVQGEDNKYYLNHLIDGTYNSSGSIFLDKDCVDVFADKHSVIYGHHMRNNTMFSALMDYKKQEFYDEHSVALYITPERRCKILLFSGYVARPTEHAWRVDFVSNSFEDWLTEIGAKSMFTSKYVPTADDQIVTLSTCSYEFDDARFVVHGILLDYTP